MQRWRVLDCSKMHGRLRAQRGAIEILRDEGEPAVVPVADVSVVLVGVSVSFSTAVIHRLLREDIAVIFCDWKGVPEGAAYSNQDHCRVGARHLAQVRLSLPRKKNAWGKIVEAKVLGQANVLKEHGLAEALDLKALANDVRSGDPTNIEARAAKYIGKLSRLPKSSEDGQERAQKRAAQAIEMLILTMHTRFFGATVFVQ